jgi:hypothetical protein
VNQIEFVIAPGTLGGAPPSDTIEAVIDGRSLVDWINDGVGEISYLGLRDRPFVGPNAPICTYLHRVRAGT